MIELDFPMRAIFLFIPFVPLLEQNKCYTKHIDAVTFNSRLEFFQLLMSHVSLAFPSASKKKSIIPSEKSDGVLVLFKGHVYPQPMKVMLVSGTESWLEKACDMPTSMLFFLIITLWEFVCVCSRMKIHTYFFPVPSSAFGHFMFPFANKCAFLVMI